MSQLAVVAVGFGLLGCQSQRDALVLPQDVPDAFQAAEQKAPTAGAWLDRLGDPWLKELARRALLENRALLQQRARVEVVRESAVIRGADRLPSLQLRLDGDRGRAFAGASVDEAYTATALVSFDADLWGRLSDAHRQAQLSLAAEELAYLAAQRSLVADIAQAAYDVAIGERLLDLFEHRLATLEASLDVIERGYRSGLNPALDVYLARSTLEQERVNVRAQAQALFEAANRIHLLVSDYPDGSLRSNVGLDQLQKLAVDGVPSDVLLRRADIQSAWLALLASDAALAAAQKNRFPSLSLTANLRDTATSLDSLVDDGDLPWSVAASLLQPVFQGGRLRALARQAQADVQAAEQRYLETVYAAFAQAENAMASVLALDAQVEATAQAQGNAEAALSIAEDEYQRGLVPYTTVLEAQRRAFDAQSSLLRLQNQYARSRIDLFTALGGEYAL